jgi:glycerol-3-phosphate dehydrogenase
MSNDSWRHAVLARLPEPWDLVIIGGGITGAGVFREATALGLKALLLDQSDFASGTSSRSGKLVHGGLRYLKQGHINTTRHSVRERERLLREAPGLVEPLGFLLPISRKKPLDRLIYGAGLYFYDLLAGRKTHRYCQRDAALMQAPHISQELLKGCFCWEDAQADDARMVLRLILETVDDGGTALNYSEATELLTDRSGEVTGVLVSDRETGKTAEVRARAVINAAGAWSDTLRGQVGGRPIIRPLRGSHLIFPGWRLPVAQAVSFTHPDDHRLVYVFPWEGITLVGTTDLDHRANLDEEPAITLEEKEYLLKAAMAQFPTLDLRASDAISTFAGVRPVAGTGKKDPSKESREMFLLKESGLVTITGGKLTTFRLLALRALKAVAPKFSLDLRDLTERRVYKTTTAALAGVRSPALAGVRSPALAGVVNRTLAGLGVPALPGIKNPALARRLSGRYGNLAPTLVGESLTEELEEIPGTPYIWAELRHAARHECVVHLDDLMLRRVRLGLLLHNGGLQHADRIKSLVAPELGWDDRRWDEETRRYHEIWRTAYGPEPVRKGGLTQIPPGQPLLPA